MKRVGTILVALSSILALAGCSAERAGDSDVEVSTNTQLTDTNASSGFFVVTRKDVRRCASPMCGGWFVKRVNEAETRCADGTLQAECYVSSIELGNLGLSQEERDTTLAALTGGQGLVQATLTDTSFGTLDASNAWVGATGSTATGTFFLVADNGTRCVTTPCPSITASELNEPAGGETHNVLDVVLDRTPKPASQESLEAASQALATQEGLLVAGSLLLPKCAPNTDCGPKVIASEFYLSVTNHPVANREGAECGTLAGLPCGPGQFCFWESGAMCGAADAPGKCIYPPSHCTSNVQPVCGCDGKTYSNPCIAASQRASVFQEGACP
ncbi:DUF6748 domain-containing protein [Pendulispora albinea]|uniref:Kazal-type serine protease inhibitor n=1 Tax=Pendulispora albinea TaxID=2741071 RepID=A0ABZ2LLG8_9BACT